MIVTSHECCVELSDKTHFRIIITENSADDNLAAELTLMILQSESTDTQKLSVSDELMLIYLFLNMNIAS